jgi:phosphatidate cytidylyltransferase
LSSACVLRTRIATAAVLLPAVLAAVIFAPNWFFTLFIAVLGVFGLYEIAAMTGTTKLVAIPLYAVVGGVPLFGLLYGDDPGWWLPAIIVVAMLVLVARIALAGRAGAPSVPALAFTGAAYVGVLFPYFAMLRDRSDGVRWIITVLLLAVASDSGAYFVGRQVGRTKLAENVSPHKTVEGAVGGMLATVAAGLILDRILAPMFASTGSVVFFSAMISILAQLGDLAGSAFKRAAGVKDSGWIFPGHGGLLDRTCSLVFAMVFTYYWQS